MNVIKIKIKNRLREYRLDMLIRVKSCQLHGNSNNFDSVYQDCRHRGRVVKAPCS